MRRTLQYTTFLMLAILALAGCKKEEPPPPEPVAPPPPSAAQIHGELKNAVNALWNPYNGGTLCDAEREAVVNNLRPLLATHRNSVNGPEAIGMLRRDLTDLIQQATVDDRQGVVYGAILAF